MQSKRKEAIAGAKRDALEEDAKIEHLKFKTKKRKKKMKAKKQRETRIDAVQRRVQQTATINRLIFAPSIGALPVCVCAYGE